MTVIVLVACPEGLRGHLTRWMLEISPGVFVGNITARVRAFLWSQVKEHSKRGRAILVYSTNTEQGLEFETWFHDWKPTDHDGMTLITRTVKEQESTYRPGPDKYRRRRY